jgi:hypothetical protein
MTDAVSPPNKLHQSKLFIQTMDSWLSSGIKKFHDGLCAKTLSFNHGKVRWEGNGPYWDQSSMRSELYYTIREQKLPNASQQFKINFV